MRNLEQNIESLLKEALSQHKEATLEGSGWSMSPLLEKGDKISFKKTELGKLCRADLVVFKKNNNYIAHRFIKIIHRDKRVYLISKSDILIKYDDPIRPEDIIGRVTRIQKPNATIYLDSPGGKFKSYLNIFIAPFYYFMFSIFKNGREPGGESRADEKEFLKSVLGITPDMARVEKLRGLIQKDLNWDYILEKAKWNLIMPFFLRNVVNGGLRGQVPADVLEKAKKIYYWQIYHDTASYANLDNLLDAFYRQNIKIIILKGAQLGEEIYKDTFLRQMGDIDILAKIDDWPEIKAVFLGLGFNCRQDEYDTWGLSYLDNHIAFSKNNKKIELKFNLWPVDFPYFRTDIWDNSREVFINGQKAFVPSLEDTLLIACVSLARHDYSGLIWFYDIKEIIAKFTRLIDWEELIRRAKEKDIDCMVYYALYYSSKLLDYKLPEGILKRLHPVFLKRCLHRFFWDKDIILWLKEGYPPRARISFEVAVLLFAGKISLKPQKLFKLLKYIYKIILPGKKHLLKRCKVKNKSPRLVFCYIWQPFRFLFMFLDSGISLVFRRRQNL